MTSAESVQASTSNQAALPFDRAHADLAQALQDAISSTAHHESVNARFTEYLTLLQAAMSGQDVAAPCAQAYAIYIAALQDALAAEPQQQRAVQAFDRYAHALRDAWAATDPRTLTPHVVASIAQQVMTAATTVAGIGRPQLRTSGGASPPDITTG